ncbi:hypothetical protein PI124_g23739, partial [Phytophthora idaei]
SQTRVTASEIEPGCLDVLSRSGAKYLWRMLIDDGRSLGFFAGKLSTDEYTRVDVQNAQESYRVVADIITEHAAARPTNTNNTVRLEASRVYGVVR